MDPDRGVSQTTASQAINEPTVGAGANSAPLTLWRLAQVAAGSAADPSKLRVADDDWLPATAPGTVAAALRAAGKWNRRDATNLDDFDWWYRCHFRCDDPNSGGLLKFAGLASLADVWINGRHVLASDNMFITHVVDVGSWLVHDNELVIRFRSLNAELKTKRARPKWRARLVSHQNLRWIRTTLLGHMPSWSSTAQPVGPWRGVSLIDGTQPRIAESRLHARIDSGDGIVSLSARISLVAGLDISAATVTIGTIEREAVIRPSNGELVVSASIRVPSPRMWWPHTHGDQPLYDATLTLTIGDARVSMPLGRVAFRSIDLSSANGDFNLRINGTKIFWRGACWSPTDILTLHGSRAEYHRTLQLARDAGMNMLRVGGTMVYEHDDFYDLCDELGIAVWQDLMFANMDYPATDEAFVASAEREVTQLLERIGSRASLALVCGNSEVEQQAAMLGLHQSEWRSSLFSETFARLVAEHAPGIPYWPSSPSGGSLPFHVNAGDGHYFGYGAYLRAASDVRTSAVRFASECLAISNVPEPGFVDRMSCGVAGAGHHPDWKRGVARDAGAAWDFEDVRDRYVREMFGVEPAVVRYADPEHYLALGRVAGGELITRTIAEWRHPDSSCDGALVWMYRDMCPGAGWGVLDSDGSPKAAYYYLARSYRPIAVVMTDEGLNGVRLNVINDRPLPISTSLRLSLFNGSVAVVSVAVPLTIGAHSSVSLDADRVLGSFTDISYAYRFGRPNHDAIVATLSGHDGDAFLDESFHFPSGIGSIRTTAQLRTGVIPFGESSYELTVSADELAIAVAIDAPGWTLSDNYFHIAPECERRVLLCGGPPGADLTGHVTALNSRTATGFRA